MERIYISDISNYEGQEVVIKGWLYNKRSSGKLHFLQVRDGTGTVQCVVYKGDVSAETFKQSTGLQQESSVIIYGTVKKELFPRHLKPDIGGGLVFKRHYYSG